MLENNEKVKYIKVDASELSPEEYMRQLFGMGEAAADEMPDEEADETYIFDFRKE